MPSTITLIFKETYDSFPPHEGKPTDDDLLSIRETILSLLMVIPYNLLGGIHSLTAILTNPAKIQGSPQQHQVRPSNPSPPLQLKNQRQRHDRCLHQSGSGPQVPP